MKKNTAIITGLFMLMILAFTVDTTFIYHFQNNLLGKAIIILVLIYLTMNNVTFGLLFTLAIILISTRLDIPMIEGYTPMEEIKIRDSIEREYETEIKECQDRFELCEPSVSSKYICQRILDSCKASAKTKRDAKINALKQIIEMKKKGDVMKQINKREAAIQKEYETKMKQSKDGLENCKKSGEQPSECLERFSKAEDDIENKRDKKMYEINLIKKIIKDYPF